MKEIGPSFSSHFYSVTTVFLFEVLFESPTLQGHSTIKSSMICLKHIHPTYVFILVEPSTLRFWSIKCLDSHEIPDFELIYHKAFIELSRFPSGHGLPTFLVWCVSTMLDCILACSGIAWSLPLTENLFDIFLTQKCQSLSSLNLTWWLKSIP